MDNILSIKAAFVISWLLLLRILFTDSDSYAQRPIDNVQLDSLPAQGILADKGWRFQVSDDPHYAQMQLNDRGWTAIDPTQDIRDLPLIEKAGVCWLRLHITTSHHLPPVLIHIFQSVASEVYLDGRFLYSFGTISRNPDSVRAYNPYAAFSLPLHHNTSHVLAIRMACQPALDYAKIYLGRPAPLIRINFFPATEIPAISTFNLESVYSDMFKIGICFILLILHLSLFIAYRQQLANLYAAAMYGLLGIQNGLRAACDLIRWAETRMILRYYTLLIPCIAGLMVLIFYSLFNIPKRWTFWLTIGSIVLTSFPVPTEYHWLKIILAYVVPVELIRISVVAFRHHMLGAKIILTGVLCNVGIDLVHQSLSLYNVPIIGNEWLTHLLFNFSFLCVPLALSLRLSLEHGWINRQLSLKLEEVKELSARNMAEQHYRQQLLAEQNERLEQQVEVRTKELRQQAEQLQKLDTAKSRFVTNLTHELRTPLSLIISPVAKLLESPHLTQELQTSLQLVDRNAHHLLNQVNQLLDIARLEDGRMSLSLRPVKLGHLTTQLVDLFQATAEAAQIGLTLHINGEDKPILLDQDKWGKIVCNLLANALKFTSVGGRVGVQLILEETQVQLCLQDTGIGIDPEKLPYIFDRFYQIDDATTRSFEGTGVGLALVRELTSLLGGSVTVESQLGEGSSFAVELPIQTAPPTIPYEVALSPLPVAVIPSSKILNVSTELSLPLNGQDDRALVLVVEDNVDLCQFISNELLARYRVLTAYDGQQGWTLTQSHLPDIVISDVMMPRMDGYELTNLIKSTAETEHIAVILLTARTSQDDRLEGLQKGADDYLVKPFDLVELQLRLSNLINRQKKLRAIYLKQLLLPTENAEVGVITSIDPLLERIYALLEVNLDNSQVSVEWLSGQLAMDRKTLYRKLQSKIQLSPNALIRMYKLRRGYELLQAGKSVTETAYSVGFDNVTYFSQCFKKQYHLTPTEFINNTV